MRAIIIPSREQIASFEAFYAGSPSPAPWRPLPRPRGWTASGRGPPHVEPRLVTAARELWAAARCDGVIRR